MRCRRQPLVRREKSCLVRHKETGFCPGDSLPHRGTASSDRRTRLLPLRRNKRSANKEAALRPLCAPPGAIRWFLSCRMSVVVCFLLHAGCSILHHVCRLRFVGCLKLGCRCCMTLNGCRLCASVSRLLVIGRCSSYSVCRFTFYSCRLHYYRWRYSVCAFRLPFVVFWLRHCSCRFAHVALWSRDYGCGFPVVGA